jgi:hypothetical protein
VPRATRGQIDVHGQPVNTLTASDQAAGPADNLSYPSAKADGALSAQVVEVLGALVAGVVPDISSRLPVPFVDSGPPGAVARCRA